MSVVDFLSYLDKESLVQSLTWLGLFLIFWNKLATVATTVWHDATKAIETVWSVIVRASRAIRRERARRRSGRW